MTVGDQPNYTREYAQYRRDMMRYANTGIIPPGVSINTSRVMAQYKQDADFRSPPKTSDKGGHTMTENTQENANLTLPDTVADLFPSRWLSASDLNGRTFDLTIDRVEPGMFPIHPRTREKELKAVIYFEKAHKGLILNSTQATQIAEIAENQRFEDWPGTRVTLAPGKAPNGKPTIIIRPAPAPTSSATPSDDTAKKDPASILAKEGREEKLPSGSKPDIDKATGEIFDYRYGDGSIAGRSDQPAFSSYRRAHAEAVPKNRGILVDWVFKVKTSEIAKDYLDLEV